MRAAREIPAKSGALFRFRMPGLCAVLAPVFMVLSDFAVAAESEAANCSAFIEYPALYDDCLQNNPAFSPDTDSDLATADDSAAPCSCGIRKQQQDEFRLPKKAKQAAKLDRVIYGNDARPR